MKKLIALLLIITLTSCGSVTLTTFTSSPHSISRNQVIIPQPQPIINFDLNNQLGWNYNYYRTPFNNFNYLGYSFNNFNYLGHPSYIWLGNVYDRWYWNRWRPIIPIRTYRTPLIRSRRFRLNNNRTLRLRTIQPNTNRTRRSTGTIQPNTNRTRRSTRTIQPNTNRTRRSNIIRNSRSSQSQKIKRSGRRTRGGSTQ